ncbi:MAG: hypothetical protein ACRYGI_11085 [Janthinobacterium lividum]
MTGSASPDGRSIRIGQFFGVSNRQMNIARRQGGARAWHGVLPGSRLGLGLLVAQHYSLNSVRQRVVQRFTRVIAGLLEYMRRQVAQEIGNRGLGDLEIRCAVVTKACDLITSFV